MLEYLLSILFGSHIGPIDLIGPSNPVIHEIFKNFNIIIMSSVVILISCMTLVSTVSTANNGKIMGGRWSPTTTLLRSMLGIFFLSPMPGSGYSTMQVSSIYLAMQASKFATQTLTLVMEQFEQGKSVTRSVELPAARKLQLQKDGEELAWQLLNSAICMQSMQTLASGRAINYSQDKVHPTSFIAQFGKLVYPERIAPYSLIATATSAEYAAKFEIGVFSPQMVIPDGGNMICGSFNIKSIVGKQELAQNAGHIAEYALDAAKKKQATLYTIFKHLLPLATRITEHHSKNTEHYIAIIKEYIKESGDIYVESMSTIVNPKRAEHSTEVYAFIEKTKQSDWMGMGAWYANLGKAPPVELLETAYKPAEINKILDNNALSIPTCDSAKLPRIERDESVQELGLIQKYVFSKDERSYLCEKLTVVHQAKNTDQSVDLSASASNSARGELHTLSSVMNIIQNFQELIQQTRITKGRDIIALQIDFGNKLIIPAEQYLTAPSFTMNLDSIALIVAWLCGMILVFYIPLMPCIMYTIAVLGWFVLVVQSFFVLPILGVSLVMPSNEMVGRIAKKLALPLEIVLLPFLNVSTFLLSICLYKIGVELINLIMLGTITSNFLGASRLAAVMGIVIYMVLTLIVLNICFSLFYKISKAIITAVQETLSYQDSSLQVQQTAAINTMVAPTLVATQVGNVDSSNRSAASTVGSDNGMVTKDPSGLSATSHNSTSSPSSSETPPLVPSA